MHSLVKDDTSIHAMQIVASPFAVNDEVDDAAVKRDGVIKVTLTYWW
jgi:hypothetical protein